MLFEAKTDEKAAIVIDAHLQVGRQRGRVKV
jgi:ATP-dependent Zn protease